MKRIVRMHFQPELVERFLTLFRHYEDAIRNADGCEHMELLRDTQNPCVYFTWSIWKSEDHLNSYRNSSLFNEIWPQTKELFAEPAMAWSTEMVTEHKAR